MGQPESVIQGSALAAAGSALLGFRRAHLATLILPLLYGDTAQQRQAAEGYEELAAGLRRHPEVVDSATRDVTWTAASAKLAMDAVAAYSADAERKADLPEASARTLHVAADVYEAAGTAVLLTGASIFIAGVMHKYARLNPFTRAVSEVAATQFGSRADRQAGAMANRVRQFAAGGQGVLGKVVGHLAKVSPGRLAIYGGVAVGGGILGQHTVATRFSETKLQQELPGMPLGQTGLETLGEPGLGLGPEAGPEAGPETGSQTGAETGSQTGPWTRAGDEPGDEEVRRT
ncbi:hypothetical protein [Nonomuraea sp. NPDC049309]|uniref:hypothetical protein n=1 Tax=Nonomuraea sp. NPDC049309 TaxID=3364350 RepID=UPI0037188003